MKSIKFISYDGSYPTLCFGELVVKISDVEFKFVDVLNSGGGFKRNGDTYEGDWELDVDAINSALPEGYKLNSEEIRYLTKLVNSKVRKGCCGGCL